MASLLLGVTGLFVLLNKNPLGDDQAGIFLVFMIVSLYGFNLAMRYENSDGE